MESSTIVPPAGGSSLVLKVTMFEGIATGLIVALIVEGAVYIRGRKQRRDAQAAIQDEVQPAQSDLERADQHALGGGVTPNWLHHMSFEKHLLRYPGTDGDPCWSF